MIDFGLAIAWTIACIFGFMILALIMIFLAQLVAWVANKIGGDK